MGDTLGALVCSSNCLPSTGSNCHHHFWDIPDYGSTSGFVAVFDVETWDSVERILSGCLDINSTGKSINFTADFLCIWPIMCFPYAGEGLRPLDTGIAGFTYSFIDLFAVEVGQFV
jgi:hypothetical protein